MQISLLTDFMGMIFIDDQIFGGIDIAKLRPAQSNSNSVGWALISTFSYNMAILAISQPFQVEL